jgi:DNA-binding CsgD family transcriptional regulator
MKKRGNRPPSRPARGAIRVRPKEFIFLDRATGKARFSVKAASDGNLPVDETSSLLAMHCVLHSQTLADFRIMLSVGDDLLRLVVPRAQQLIDSCSHSLMPIRISARQQQVLRWMFQNLRNKEIAAQMNVAERTVKFHVSALLHKFKVADRASLIQKVDELVSSQGLSSQLLQFDLPQEIPSKEQPDNGSLRPALVRFAAGERRAGR